MNAICLTIDRWQAGYVGAYGNGWIGTPNLDRLASKSLVFDFALADSPHLENLAWAYWHGLSAMESAATGPVGCCLLDVLAEAGVTTALISDEQALVEHPLASRFDDVVTLPARDENRVRRSIEQTAMGRCFAAAVDWLRTPPERFCLWLHCRGMGAAWDAPLDLRNHFVEDDEPLPPQTAAVPSRILGEVFNPDELLGIRRAYAGQVLLLDRCIGAFRETMDEHGLDRNTLLVALGARGMPLGEHGHVGSTPTAPLHAELVHVPLMLRVPNEAANARRFPALVAPGDLAPTLLDGLHLPGADSYTWSRSLMPIVRRERETVRDRHVVIGDRERAICTPGWYLREAALDRQQKHLHLYAKPDDRWEVNDVADRCPDVASRLEQTLEEVVAAVGRGGPITLTPLDAMLKHGVR